MIDHTGSVQAPEYLYFHPYSDQNLTLFYLDVAADDDNPEKPQDVISNEGKSRKSVGRIGE
jgi:hypothetical protein